jgi:hypothetical protein
MLFFVSLSVVPLLTETYLADKGKAGKRGKSSEEAEKASLDEKDEEDEAGADEADKMMPASASKKKTPKAAPKATAVQKTPNAPTAKGDDDVNRLADDVQASLNLNSWYKIDRSQEFSIFACVFPDLQSQMRYVYIQVELVGSIESSQVKARIVRYGDAAEVTIKFQKGGELTNPEHCLVQFVDKFDFDVGHPLFLAMNQIHCFHGKLNEESEIVLIVDLPFRYNTQGFNDLINEEQNEFNLGIFPLPNAKE